MMWAWLWMGCVLGPKPVPCDANEACRAAFGFGAACGDDGYCAAVEVNPRCATTYPSDLFSRPEKYGESVVIASVFNGAFDEKLVKSVELAVRNINDADGIGGRDVAIVHCDNTDDLNFDDLDSVTAAGEIARYLSADLGIAAIVGPSTSDESFSMLAAIAQGQSVIISPSATSPELTAARGVPSPESPGTFWRTVPPDDLQAFAIAQDLLDRGVTSISVVFEEGSYGRPLAEAVSANFTGGGRTATLLDYSGDTLLSAAIGEAIAAPVDEVVFLTSEVADAVKFLNGAGAAYADQPIFLADASAEAGLFGVSPAGEALLPNIRGSRPKVPVGPIYDGFVRNYELVYPGDTPTDAVFTSYAFDAAWLALYGALWADLQGEPLTGRAVGSGILQLRSGPALTIGFATLSDVEAAFAAGASVDIEGSSGDLDFDSRTGEVNNPVEIWVVDEANQSFRAVKICAPGGVCEAVE